MSRNIFGYEWRVDRANLQKFAEDCRGVAMIEFAFVSPLLIITLFGVVEVGRAIQLDRKFDMVTTMMSDQVAREEDFGADAAERDEILERMKDAIDHVMLPYDASKLSMTIIPVARPEDAGETPYIYAGPFDHNNYDFAPGKCADFTGAEGGGQSIDITSLVPPGGRIIVVRAKYEFQPIFTKPFKAGGLLNIPEFQVFEPNTTWESFSVHSPRHNCNKLNKDTPNPCPLSRAQCQAY